MEIKIGDFSRLSLVSVKMLRHYDRLGLLRPARVDRDTGYRYYTLDQVPRLNRLLALKDLGFSLRQVAHLLGDDLPPATLRAMLAQKQAELRAEIRAGQERLARVEARLAAITGEDTMGDYTIELRAIPAQTVAAARTVAPDAEALRQFCFGIHDLVAGAGVRLAGPWQNIYHHAEFRDRDIDVETAAPVEAGAADTLARATGGRVTVRELPAVPAMACLRYTYSPAAIVGAYQALGAWIAAHGYTIAGPGRELWLGESGDPPALRNEIQFPVARP